VTRKPSKNQLADLWLEEYGRRGHCCLCGNSGVIDTRGKVFTPANFECGDLVYCICPNGRAMKRQEWPLPEST
jgi:hypothetical protein